MFNTVILLSRLPCTNRATLSAIVYFEWSAPVPLKNDARETPGKSAISELCLSLCLSLSLSLSVSLSVSVSLSPFSFPVFQSFDLLVGD